MNQGVARKRATVAILLAALLAVGCSSSQGARGGELNALRAESVAGFAVPDRKMRRSGRLTVSLDDLDRGAREVERLVAEVGGYVEQSTATTGSHVSLQCRVPAAHLERTMDEIAALGEERRRSISAEDVTDQYADLATRLRNNRALRDRLQELLSRATKVEDVLAIEQELNRIQSEVESMQGHLDRLKSQVELCVLSITLDRDRILGPLGYLGYGLWWALSKLFVIR